MRVLYLCSDPGISLSANGGGSIHIREFVRALAGLGNEVTVVGAAGSEGKHHEQRLGPSIRVADAPPAAWNRALGGLLRGVTRLLGHKGRKHPDFVRFLHNFTFAGKAARCAGEGGPDFIYERYSLWGLAGLWLAKCFHAPLVLEVNAPLVDEQLRYRKLAFPGLARRLEHFVWRRADRVVAVSDAVRLHIQRAGVPAGRIIVLPNGVDPDVFHPLADGQRVRELLGLEGRFIIGLSGTFKLWHGTDLLLAAFEDVHQADQTSHLLLAGDGPVRAKLEQEVRAKGLCDAVTFTGGVPHTEMPEYLAAMDVAVAPYPKLDDFYFSPLKLYEYMAAGRAIVASRAGQVAEILTNGVNALLYEPGEKRGLVECILRLRRDENLRRTLGEEARLASLNFTWSNNAARVVGQARMLAGAERETAEWREGPQHGI